uniref:Uncharacterized protein n=1 Tax=Daphnia magna TaxID=35525 RepID=A0A0P6EB41_9CRUS
MHYPSISSRFRSLTMQLSLHTSASTSSGKSARKTSKKLMTNDIPTLLIELLSRKGGRKGISHTHTSKSYFNHSKGC